MAKTMLEKQIQLSVCEYLFDIKQYFGWRQNTSPIFDTKSGFYRPMPKYSITGLPDIVLIIKGKFIGLEIKRPKGKQSDNQKYFQTCLEAAGGEYHIITSVEDCFKLGL